MKIPVIFLLLFSLLSMAQTQQTPIAAGEDISGMYTFLHDGEFVQINVEDSRVTGYVSRQGDRESNKGAFLDHLFKEAELKGDEIHFMTRQVHGVWFEFTGTVARGEETDPSKEGFRVLKGKLTKYTEGEKEKPEVESREVILKSFPMGALLDKSK